MYFVTWRLQQTQQALTFDERTQVADCLAYHADSRYLLIAFVVMNDHVHALVKPLEAYRLERIVYTWKSFSANQILRNSNRSGAIWQPEYFDRICRDEEDLREKCNYMINNPKKRWPEITEYQWLYVNMQDGHGDPSYRKTAG